MTIQIPPIVKLTGVVKKLTLFEKFSDFSRLSYFRIACDIYLPDGGQTFTIEFEPTTRLVIGQKVEVAVYDVE